MFTVGKELTKIVTVPVPAHPPLLPETEYVVVVEGVTAIAEALDPVFHV